MRSLRTRILFSASLVLVVFLGATSVLLDRAFQDSAMNAVADRLRGRVFMLIGAADFDVSRDGTLIKSLPDPALSIPAAGHYARILAADGRVLWSSASMLGVTIPTPDESATGRWLLQPIKSSTSGEKLFALTYGIIWEGVGDRAPAQFVLQAFENEALYLQAVNGFRRSLWLWFAGLSVALLLVQALNLSRGLRPLTEVGEEVRAVELGEREQLTGQYPTELSTLTTNLNKLLRANRDSLRRYRDSLGDLAHSIKTPLAVLRNELDHDQQRDTSTAAEQIKRIDRTVQYYLERSATAGRSAMAPPLAVAPIAERIAASLAKVHAAKSLNISVQIAPEIKFAADEGDLMEVIGNLADNACKWARRSVNISASGGSGASQAGGRLIIEVRDDGPGIPDEQIELLKQRGTRLDQSVEGHGIGLAIVREMVEQAYGGRFTLASDDRGTLARAEMSAA